MDGRLVFGSGGRAALPLLGLLGCVSAPGCARISAPLEPLVADEQLLSLVTGHAREALADPKIRREIQRNWSRARQDKRAFVELSVLSRMQAQPRAPAPEEQEIGPLGPGLDTSDARALVPPHCAAPAIVELWFTSAAHPWLPASTQRDVYAIVSEAVACAFEEASPTVDPQLLLSARVGLWAWAHAFAPLDAELEGDVDGIITDEWRGAVLRELGRGCPVVAPEREVSMDSSAEEDFSDDDSIDELEQDDASWGVHEPAWGPCPIARGAQPDIGVEVDPAPVIGHARSMTLAQIGQLQQLLERASDDERHGLELSLARLWIAVELGETDPQAANAAASRALNLLMLAVSNPRGAWTPTDRQWHSRDEALLLAVLVASRMNRPLSARDVLLRLINDSENATMDHVGMLLFGDMYCSQGDVERARSLWSRAEQDEHAGLAAAARARACVAPDAGAADET